MQNSMVSLSWVAGAPVRSSNGSRRGGLGLLNSMI